MAGGVVGLVSFGLAGGLNPAWRPGALVIPEAVRDGDAIYLTDAVLRDRFGPANARLLVAGPEIVADAAAKRALFAAEGAVAVDLESGAVGRVARHHGLGFAVLRAICDPAERDLPPAARAALDARGAIGLLGVLVSLAREPGQFAALLRLAGDARRARSALIAVSRRCRAETTPPPG